MIAGDEHRRPQDTPLSQRDERFGGLPKGNRRRPGSYPRLRCDGEEIQPVLPGEIGNRHQLPLFPQQAVRESRNIAHVYPRADDLAAPAHRAQCHRYQRSDRRVDDGGIERLGRHLIRSSGPFRAEATCKRLRREIEERYPAVWQRIQKRRAFMCDKIGVDLKPSILPLSNTPLCLPPFWLAPEKLLVAE